MAPGVSAADRVAFEAWRVAAPTNARAFAAVESLWQKLDGLEDDAVIGPYVKAALEPEPDVMESWTRAIGERRPRVLVQPRRRRKSAALALAAGVFAGTIGLMLGTKFWPGAEQVYQSGERTYSVVLADGSRLKMDLATQVNVEFGASRRELRLMRGRAIFEVAHDGTRPFVVDADGGRITALGTRFQVDVLDGDSVVVTLIEGAIALDNSGRRYGWSGRSAPIELSAGEQARYSRTTSTWTREDADVMSATSWSEGFHVFSATPLARAVEEINKYSPVKLRLADSGLDGLVLSGNFKAGDASNVAVALPVVLPVAIEQRENEIIIVRQ